MRHHLLSTVILSAITLSCLPASAQDPAHLLTRGEMAEIVYGVMEK